MQVDLNDERLQSINNEKQQQLNKTTETYQNMINDSQNYYQNLITAAEDYGKTQQDLQQQQSDLAVQKIENDKAKLEKNYIKEQKGAYTDYQKQVKSDIQGQANAGLLNTGFSESSQVSMYNTYQNRVATAKESYTQAATEYDMGIKDAMLQNSAALAEIAYNSLQQKLKLSLEGFQYKNDLITQQINAENEMNDRYYSRWRDMYGQIVDENKQKEAIRQYEENMKLQREKMEFEKQQAAQEQANWEKQYALSKAKLAARRNPTDDDVKYKNGSLPSMGIIGAAAGISSEDALKKAVGDRLLTANEAYKIANKYGIY